MLISHDRRESLICEIIYRAAFNSAYSRIAPMMNLRSIGIVIKDSRVHLRGQLSDARNAQRFTAAEDR